MRIILIYAAVALIRLARLEMAWSDHLLDRSDAALTRSRARVDLAHRLAGRTGLQNAG
ncbi:hypothetical protein [Methylobacterium sp. A54F]